MVGRFWFDSVVVLTISSCSIVYPLGTYIVSPGSCGVGGDTCEEVLVEVEGGEDG